MEQLKRRLARGDTEAFVELYDLLGDRLLRYLTARLNAVDAHDVLQEVFARLVRYHRRLGKSKNLNAYVFLTARNEVNRWTQKRNRTSHARLTANEADISDHEISFEHRIEQAELAANLLSQLSDESREIVELKIYSELTFSEIADILKRPDATVATKYRRAILKMQDRIDALNSTSTLAQRNETRT